MADSTYQFCPIGYFSGGARYREEAPRQPIFAGSPGRIELLPGKNYEAALEDLSGFERIWVLFVFHLNAESGWKPKASPPLTPDGAKYGVFATRAPYRPNPIGMSCLEIVRIKGRTIEVGASDLLSGTPILDIKPYIPEVDAWPQSRAGWRDELREAVFEVRFSQSAQLQTAWILAQSGYDLRRLAQIQLRCAPRNTAKKRVEILSETRAVLHCRTWKLEFLCAEGKRTVDILNVAGNYPEADLAPGTPDPYSDKDVHRAFLQFFPKF